MSKRKITKPSSPNQYSRYELELHSSVPSLPDPHGNPPENKIFIYEMLGSSSTDPMYVGQTRRSLRARAYTHVSLARQRAGKNRRLEAAIRRRIAAGLPIILRVVEVVAAGAAADAAERARIAQLRARLGARLLNLGPGGERAPAGRLVPEDERRRAAAARRARQRSDDYRRHQSAVASLRRHAPEAYDRLLEAFVARGHVDTRERICRDHRLPANAITVLVSGKANGLVVDGDLLRRAREVAAELRRRGEVSRRRMLEAATASAAAPEGVTIAEVAAIHGVCGRRLAEAIRRRHCGIGDRLAQAIRARTATGRHRRGRALGRQAGRIDRRRLVWLLTAYSRGAAGLTLAVIAGRLGATQARLSHILAGRTRRPLPRRLVRRCQARGRILRGQRGRAARILSDEQVRAARRRSEGEPLESIATDLGVSKDLLSRAVRGTSYRDVAGS